MTMTSSVPESYSQMISPIFRLIPDRDAPQSVAEGPASDCRGAWVGFQRVDHFIDRVQ